MKRLRLKPLRRNAPCPACLDRNALNLVGRPYFINGVRLSSGCEVCDGLGRVDEYVRIHGPLSDVWPAKRTRRKKK